MKFKPNKLQDVITYIVDNRGKTPPLAEEGFDLIEINAVIVGSKFPRYELIKKLVSEDTYNTWFRTGHPLKGDILISTVGAIGNVAIIREDRGCIAQNLIALRPNREIVNPDYLYYFLAWDRTRQCLRNLDIGVAQPSIKVPHLLSYIDIYTPTLLTQRKIAAILSAYDDLIENNLRRIKILEEIARNLYDEWFVKFRFPGHEKVRMVDSLLGRIPEEWEVKSVTEAISINPPTKVPKEIEKPYIAMDGLSNNSMLINITEFRTGNNGAKFKNGDTLFARITPCLENGKTGYVQFLLSNDDIGIGSTEFIVLRSKTLTPEYVYFLARCEGFRGNAIKSMSGASGRQRVQYECFDKYLFPHPDNVNLTDFSRITSPMFRYIYLLSDKNKNLHSTRDLLLPRLVSGELDVSNLDIEMGDDE